jgi:hypothetical protein
MTMGSRSALDPAVHELQARACWALGDGTRPDGDGTRPDGDGTRPDDHV